MTASIKAYLVGAIVLILLLAFSWYTVHERHAGAAKVTAKVAKAVILAETKVSAGAAHAQIRETQNAIIYERAVSVPPVGDIGVVCQRTAPRTVSLPAADTGGEPYLGNGAVNSGIGPTYNPTGALLTRAHQADAQIAYLQGRIAELEKQMDDAP